LSTSTLPSVYNISNTANRRYPLNALEILYTDGSVEVDKDIELFIEGCYHPAIVLTLEK
jgi:hypothetical protein